MSLDRNFRAALNGFNRSDVVNYIEESSISHEKALRQLRDENAKLRADLERLQSELDTIKLPEPELPESEACDPIEDMPADTSPQPEPVPTEQELAAYRRAEATERNAKRRATKLYQQVNEIVTTASKQFEESGDDVKALMSDLNICLRRLNDTFAELRLNFDDTASAFAALETLELED